MYDVTIDELVSGLKTVRRQHGNVRVVIVIDPDDVAEYNLKPVILTRDGGRREARVVLFGGELLAER